jgi:histidinol-phosphatase (PHP family)
MFDYHVHTHFSSDCTVEMEDYIQPAIQRGLKGLCFTDHVDMDYPNKDIKFLLNYPQYEEKIDFLKEKYKSKLEIYKGIEFGLQPHILSEEKDFFEAKSFDYIIGSIHVAKKNELYGGDFLIGKSEHEGILDYFEDMLYCVKKFEYFSNLGHLDAVARYINGSFEASRYRDLIDEVLKILIQKGKGIELNTSGRRYGLPHFHPEPAILKRYKELGGEIITLGSDSHVPQTLGDGFEEAVDLLKACGFDYYTIFKERKLEFIKL